MNGGKKKENIISYYKKLIFHCVIHCSKDINLIFQDFLWNISAPRDAEPVLYSCNV